MLKGLDPLLTPELLMHLCAMGHGEWVAVVDANFTADWLAAGKPVVRLPGHSLRSEERRVGKECRIGCRSRWSPYH